MITISRLAAKPEYLETVAGWIYNEWPWYFPREGLAESVRYQRDSLHNLSSPCTWIAHTQDSVVGTIALINDDLEARPNYSPWLGSLYVLPEFRGAGIARQLWNYALKEARSFGMPLLYTWTAILEGPLVSAGWQFMERLNLNEQEISILKMELSR